MKMDENVYRDIKYTHHSETRSGRNHVDSKNKVDNINLWPRHYLEHLNE